MIVEEPEEAAKMYLDVNGTSSPPSHSTSDTPNTTLVKMMRQLRYREGSRAKALCSSYATVTSTVRNVEYCRLCLACSHQP